MTKDMTETYKIMQMTASSAHEVSQRVLQLLTDNGVDRVDVEGSEGVTSRAEAPGLLTTLSGSSMPPPTYVATLRPPDKRDTEWSKWKRKPDDGKVPQSLKVVVWSTYQESKPTFCKSSRIGRRAIYVLHAVWRARE